MFQWVSTIQGDAGFRNHPLESSGFFENMLVNGGKIIRKWCEKKAGPLSSRKLP